MRGVLLCGGLGTRLAPLNIINKHLIAIGEKCMVQYPLETLLRAGIKKILVITGGEHIGAFMEFLGSGRRFDCEITYKVQDEPRGIADAIRYARDFVRDDYRFVVILGDNYFETDISRYIESWQELDGAMCLLKKVKTRWHDFGVAVIKENRITRLIEKPKEFISDLVVTGIYFLTNECFDWIDNKLKPSWRNEYEITDLLNLYLESNRLYYAELDGFWSDMGTHASRKEVVYHLYQKEFKTTTQSW